MSTILSSLLIAGAFVVASAGHAMAGVPIAIPEPTSLALIAAGVAAVAWVKFRGRR
jgi:hypothetical protein